MTEKEVATRRTAVLDSARWCFLNFGYAKTSLEDIAKRANISRTLLYRIFKDKEDIFIAVFGDLLNSRHPIAKKPASGKGSKYERLFKVCEVMFLEPWAEMVGAPMSGEFYDVCARLDPEVEAKHRRVMLDCVVAMTGNKEVAEVFLLALDGLLLDRPGSDVLRRRVKVLIERFVKPSGRSLQR